MNKRKSKGSAPRDRPSPMNSNTRTNASKTPDRETRESTRPDGVYQNARFMHTVTSLIGSTLRVETQHGAEFEGIFHTFSPMFEMVLELVHKVDPATPDCISVDFVQEKMIFNIKDIVRFYAVDVDLEYASKEGFQTDAQISAAKTTTAINGEGPMRQLEEWVPDDDSVAHDLDAGGSNGWNVHDMFAKNQEFGVKTSFDPNLSGYTVQLEKDRKDSADWREKEKKAERIAAEIEKNEGSRSAADAENGDEEDHFSAVVRTERRGGSRDGGSRDGGSRESPGDDKAYVPPGRRTDGGREERGRGGGRRGGGSQRTTPPPHERRYEHDRRDSHRDHRDSHGDQQHEYRGQHADNRGHGRYGDQRQGGERNYNRSDSRGGYSRGGDERGYNREYSSREGGYSSETPPRHQPHQGRHQEQQHRDQRDHREHRGGNYASPSGPSTGTKPPQAAPVHTKEETSRKEEPKAAANAKVSAIPEVSVVEKIPQDRRRSGENSKSPGEQPHKVEHKAAADAHSATLPVDTNALPQRDNAGRSGRKVEKSRNEVATELKDFKDKFTLSTSDSALPAGGPSTTTPTVSINPTANPPPKQPSPLPADLPPKVSPGNSQKASPKPSPKPGTPPQMATHPPPAAPSPNNSESGKKVSSTLNPNAKEFTLNPKAMEFTPRPSPQRPGIAPTPPRPQTPATPQQNLPAGYPQGGFIITNAGQGQQNQQVFIPAHNNPQFMTAAQQRPFRPKEFVPGSPAGSHRQELPSPNMVTGPPILANAPLQPPGPGYPAFPQPVQVQGAGGQVHYLPQQGQHPHHAFTRMVMPTMVPGGIMPMSAMSVQGHTHTIDTISNASSLPSAFHQVPVSHGGSSQPPSLTQSNSMWGGVMSATPTGHLPGHAGGAVPPQNQPTGPPPPHNAMGTPPTNPTPNPSPGPQTHTIMGYGGGMQPPGQHPAQPNSLPPQQIPGQPGTTHYPMLVIPQGFHHGMIPTSGPPMGAPNTPGGHVMGQPGAPPTSMANMVGGPHFQYMQHQGTPNHIQMMGHHNQQ